MDLIKFFSNPVSFCMTVCQSFLYYIRDRMLKKQQNLRRAPHENCIQTQIKDMGWYIFILFIWPHPCYCLFSPRPFTPSYPPQICTIEFRRYCCSTQARGKRKHIMRFEIRYSFWDWINPISRKKYLVSNLITSFHFLMEWWRTHWRTGLMSDPHYPSHLT